MVSRIIRSSVCNTDTFVFPLGIVAYISEKATPIFLTQEGGLILAPRQSKIFFHITDFFPGLAGYSVFPAAVFPFSAGYGPGTFRRAHGQLPP